MPSSPDGTAGESEAEDPREPVQRKKISIRPIPEARKRQVTFMKRKKGLLKKAKELSILCNCDMAVLIFDKNNQCFQFASGDIAETLARFEQAAKDPDVQREHKTNADVRCLWHFHCHMLCDKLLCGMMLLAVPDACEAR